MRRWEEKPSYDGGSDRFPTRAVSSIFQSVTRKKERNDMDKSI